MTVKTFLINVAHNVARVSKRERSENFFVSKTQILRLQNMLPGYENEVTIRKHTKSVFLQYFPNASLFESHVTYVEGTKSAS